MIIMMIDEYHSEQKKKFQKYFRPILTKVWRPPPARADPPPRTRRTPAAPATTVRKITRAATRRCTLTLPNFLLAEWVLMAREKVRFHGASILHCVLRDLSVLKYQKMWGCSARCTDHSARIFVFRNDF